MFIYKFLLDQNIEIAYDNRLSCAMSRRSSFHNGIFVVMDGKNKELLSFISKNKRMKLSPNILVTKNPNWFQSLGKGIDYV